MRRTIVSAVSVRLAVVAFATFWLACDRVDRCLVDKDCAVGSRCVGVTAQDPGSCEICATPEQPYDGVDQDCNPETLDLDLDRDGDNAANSAELPGGDCDDADPTRNSIRKEACANRVDDDCDGATDEIDCADELPPVISYIEPLPGEAVYGVVEVRAYARDDVLIDRIELSVDGSFVSTATRGPDVFLFQLDTYKYVDGEHAIRVEARDLVGRVGVAEHGIFVDNHTAPTLLIESPQPGSAQSGHMPLRLRARDVGGIASFQVQLDGMMIVTATSGDIVRAIDTAELPRGRHQLHLEASDRRGTRTSTESVFSVDREGPTLSIDPPSGSQVSGVVSARITAQDTSGIRSILSGTSLSRSDSLEITLDTRRLPNGPHQWWVEARDFAWVDGRPVGNVTSSTVTWVVLNP